MAATKWQRWRRALLILLLIALVVPPAQILLVRFWNPPYSPMQLQRRIESWCTQNLASQYPIKWISLNEMPIAQIHYIWASEDQNFFRHGGFDLPQFRAALADAKGLNVRGASTITMQCARSVFLWQGRSYLRKALECYYTFWMERLLSKRRILELYLNHIELGPGIYGLGAAADHHFGKQLSQLTPHQMVALAAILPNPRNWSPTHPDATVRRKMRRVEKLAARAPFPKSQFVNR